MTSKFIRACFFVLVPGGLAVLATANPSWLARGEEPASPASGIDEAISADELREHVVAFSADAMKGRPMGSAESLLAAEYAANTLKAMGAKGGAEDESFFQRIDLFEPKYTAPSELHLVAKDGEAVTLQYGAGFTFNSYSAALETRELECLFVAAEEDMPKEADASKALVMATSAGKATKWLRAAGFDRGAGFGLVIVPRSSGKIKEASTKRSSPLRPAASLKGGIVAKVIGDWGKRAYEGELATVRFDPKAEVAEKYDVNVVGVIPGVGTEANPDLKDEVVMLCAHRDHIGLSKPRGNQPQGDDIINNGADDDASGCAMVLEVAESIAAAGGAARTVVVILVTGEEVGMVGSGFWADHPTIAPEKVVCALNFEMLGRPDPMTAGPGNIWLTGDERSSLGPTLREHGITVTADVRPEQNFFVRSDNVSFARVGIVSQTLSSFGGHRDYHRVTDEWSTLDYAHMEAAASICLAAVKDLVSGQWTPAWNEGEPKLR